MKNAFALAACLCAVSVLCACGGASLPLLNAPTVTIWASPATIGLSQSTIINWATPHATSCAASASPAQSDWTGSVATGGSKAVTPAAAGSVSYSLSCTGTDGNASNNTTVTVTSSPALAITAAVPPDGALNVPYSFQFAALNGVQPLTWMETGSLPNGLAFSAQGELSGTPTVSGAFQLVINVQDADGKSAAPDALTFNVFAHGFQATGNMTTAREYHTATLLNNGKVLIAGGNDGTNALATAEIFDPATGIFTPTAGPMTTPRSSHTATLLANGPAATNGKVLIAGGDLAHSAELFDPATGTFTPTAGSMTRGRSSHTATLLNDGRVLLAGGYGASTAELFDPATGTFSATGSMSIDRSSARAALLNNGTVLIAGGATNYGFDAIESAEVYNPATGTFTITTSGLIDARSSHTATLLSSGKVLITGGVGEDPELATAELFDPTTQTFSLTGSMSIPRESHTATLLSDGTVLIAGGPIILVDASRTEIFDPVHGTFSLAAKMETIRLSHTATLLADGHVLITGGGNGSGGVLKSAELYN